MAYWKPISGWAERSVVEVSMSSKEVDGKQIKASRDDS